MESKNFKRYTLFSGLMLSAFLAASPALADEVQAPAATTNQEQTAQADAQQEALANQPQVTVIASQKDGDTTTTTSEVTSQELTDTVNSVDTFNKDNNLSGEEAVKVEQTETQTQPSVEAADADNKAQAQAIKQALADYQKQVDNLPAAQEQYQKDLAAYQTAKQEYEVQKRDYDAYKAELEKNPNGPLAVAADQNSGLIYTNEPNAVLSLDGVDLYITPDSVKQHTDGVDISEQFNTDNYMTEGTSNYDMSNFTTENPFDSKDDAWIKMKVGDTVTATYDGLENSSYNGEKLSKVVITFTLDSTTNNNGDAIVKLFHDPTKTVFFGAQTSNPGQKDELKMTLHLTFYNMKGEVVDLGDNRSVMGMSSLNHYQSHVSNGATTNDPNDPKGIGNHIESVAVGNNTFIKIPGSSVDLHGNEAYSANDNQYKDYGATFNGDGADGWDSINADGTARNNTAYYGAAAMTYKGEPFSISVKGNNVYRPTNFWFTVNSIVTVPQDPGQPPVEPEEPELEAPTVTWHKNIVVTSTTEEKPQEPQTPKPKNPSPQPQAWKNTEVTPKVVESQVLPETGDQANYGVAVFGAGIIAFTVATTMMASLKRKKD